MKDIKTSDLINELKNRSYFTDTLLHYSIIDWVLGNLNEDQEYPIELDPQDYYDIFKKAIPNNFIDVITEKVQEIILENYKD